MLRKENKVNSNLKIFNKKNFYRKFGKRQMDILIATPSIIILLPILLLISITIKLDSKGPIIYKQKRVGKSLEEFYIYKFRTMIVNADQIGPKSTKENDRRITKIGNLLRKFSLDELPQLVNVLMGKMSIVGYRPGLKENYTEEELKSMIFFYKPGITGYAQIYGRSAILQQEKRRLEYQYCNEISFVTDFKIIMKTIKIVLKRDGVN